jgi:heavy metal sensor kinase
VSAWPRTVRARLTGWYALALTLVLLIYAGSIFAFLRLSLYEQLDHHLRDHIEAAEQMLERSPEGGIRWRPRHNEAKDEADPTGRWIDVFGGAGELLCQEPAGEPVLPAPPREQVGTTLTLRSGLRVRVMARRSVIDGVPVLIRIVRSEDMVGRELEQLLAILGLGLPLAVGAASLAGWALARRALSPVGRMAERARSITAESLGERLPTDGSGDELDQLASVVNATLERLERSFEQLRRFTADASHELRTPLTALRSVGEVALGSGVDAPGARDVIASMLEETDRLTRLVDSLLMLSRADAGTLRLEPESFDLSDLAREVASFLGVLAEEKGQAIAIEAGGPVAVRADRALLRQAAVNLLDNAIKYSPRGASIRLRTGDTGKERFLEVIDRGLGIAPEHRERVFDRFYRVDSARSREHGGTGLGLAIARRAVLANGGRIELESDAGTGSTFRIVLPSPA